MEAIYIDYKDTGSFSSTLLAYLDRDPRLKPFIQDWPDLAGFGRQIQEKRKVFDPSRRETLVKVLLEQYDAIWKGMPTGATFENIQALAHSETFTVTTGHQLNIFTGPLYFIFKIVSAIRLARDLKAAYPEKHFVPVYWMATEDHDFAEINHTWIRGHKISWDVPAQSATGRMLTDSMAETLRRYQGLLGLSGYAEELADMVQEAYAGQRTLAEATRHLVHNLFGRYGLVIVDADVPTLKASFADIIQQDIIGQHSHQAIAATNKQLSAGGYAVQVTDRPINFFYLTDAYRERLVQEGDAYQVLNQAPSFTQEELRLEIEQHPERFSPNVVMRPLYQEVILPNLAYIGGGAEIVYWLQLKGVFEHYQVPFPLLVPRNSAMITQRSIADKLGRLDLDFKQIFQPAEDLKKQYVRRHTDHQLGLNDEWEELSAIFEKIKLRAYKIDPTLAPSTEAVQARLQRAMRNLEKKLLKADKKNHQSALEQIDRIKEKLFPGGGLQERTENFTALYVQHGPVLFEELIKHFHPLDYRFTVLY